MARPRDGASEKACNPRFVLQLPAQLQKTFQVVGWGEKLVPQALKKLGWKDLATKSSKKKTETISTLAPGNLLWTGAAFIQPIFTERTLFPGQLINHFPNCCEISHKQKLIENLKCYCRGANVADNVWDICPETYDLNNVEELLAFLVDFVFHRAAAELCRCMRAANQQADENNRLERDTSKQILAATRILKRLSPHAIRNRLTPGVGRKGSRLKPGEVALALAPSGTAIAEVEEIQKTIWPWARFLPKGDIGLIVCLSRAGTPTPLRLWVGCG